MRVVVRQGFYCTAAASSSGAGTGGAMSEASRLLFSGLPSEVSSSPAVVVKQISGFHSCRPPHCQVDASSLIFCSTGHIGPTRAYVYQSIQYTVFPHYNGVLKKIRIRASVLGPRHLRMQQPSKHKEEPQFVVYVFLGIGESFGSLALVY